MAVITISRQVAALGDEIARELAARMNYTFIDRKQIESHIVELGFPKEKLPKYDERKPGFFASLARDRDEYLNYLQLAVIEAAAKSNVILIGRGAFAILEDLPNHIALRFVSDDKVRLSRLMNEFSWTEKQAQQRIDESDLNRRGFHKSFFNIDCDNPQFYHATLNTGLLTLDTSVMLIQSMVKSLMTKEVEAEGKKKADNLWKAQHLVNQLLFTFNLKINFLNAEITDESVILRGIADSRAVADKALALTAKYLPSLKASSQINIVQDFKTFS